MNPAFLFTIYLALGLMATIGAGVLAPHKHRHKSFWMVVCFFIPPLFILLMVLPRGGVPPRRGISRDDLEDMML